MVKSVIFLLLGSYEGGWTSQWSTIGEFLQIDLSNVTMVMAIATQGHSVKAWWVKRYTLDYANEDGNFTAYNSGQASMLRYLEIRLKGIKLCNMVSEFHLRTVVYIVTLITMLTTLLSFYRSDFLGFVCFLLSGIRSKL